MVSERKPSAAAAKGARRRAGRRSGGSKSFGRPQQDITDGAVWLFGRHAVLAAIGNPNRRLVRIVGLPSTVAELAEAARRADAQHPKAESADRHTLARLLPPGSVHQGFAALAEPLADVDLESLLATLDGAPSTILLVLDQATDPRNVGTIMRSVAAFGAAGVIVQSRHAPPASAVLAKAASGALEHVPLVRVVNIARALRSLHEAGFLCIGLDADAPTFLADAIRPGPTAARGRPADDNRLALVLGSEGSGLRRLVGEACDTLARIPIQPTVDSLNVAASAAIALYEAVRTRPPNATSASEVGTPSTNRP